MKKRVELRHKVHLESALLLVLHRETLASLGTAARKNLATVGGL